MFPIQGILSGTELCRPEPFRESLVAPAIESVVSRQFPAPVGFASATKNCLAKDTSVPEQPVFNA